MIRTEPRRKVPAKVALTVALRQLRECMARLEFVERGFAITADEIVLELDHDPCLALRSVDEETGQHVPHQHSPDFLIFRPKHQHRIKTSGTKATTFGSDIHAIAKMKRLRRQANEFDQRMTAKAEGDEPPAKRWHWPKRPLRSRSNFR